MMNMLEVFFDYACPFCLKGHGYLKELIASYPEIKIVWRPCEAHPRPESYGRHSDLCIQGMFFAQAHGVELWTYHDRMYKAAVRDRIDIEDVHALADRVKDILDTDVFIKALQSGDYAKVQLDSNDYAYKKNDIWAVPSYRMHGLKLDSTEGVGITKLQLAALMDSVGN